MTGVAPLTWTGDPLGQDVYGAEGGPVPPTTKKVAADYVYVMEFDADRIRHMTKIWNDVTSLQQLGWM